MNAFHADDHGGLSAPAAAFDLAGAGRPSALQHHLCLEVVNHMAADGVPFVFQGGTALHTRLTNRSRFSIDVDIKTPEPDAVADSLQRFVDKFPHSEIELLTPPDPLADFGIRHRIHFQRIKFGQQPCQVLVELTEAPLGTVGFETLPLQADGFTWPSEVQAPNLERFAAQKMSTLGPNTIGKRVGPNQTHYKGNQGVCKQLFDLRVLLLQNLDPAALRQHYLAEIDEANAIHNSSHELPDIAVDAQQLLSIFKGPQAIIEGDTPRRDLWKSFNQIASCIMDPNWGPEALRVAAGSVHRIFEEITSGNPNLAAASEPLNADDVPAATLQAIGDAQDRGEEWALDEDFEGSARLAWAWAPPGRI